MENKKHEKELKELSQVIVDALTRNEDVMNYLAELKDRNIIDSSTLLGLALKVNDLLEISGSVISKQDGAHSSAGRQAKAGPRTRPESENDPKELIDGKKLSDRQIAFEKWASDRFDEKGWLKKSGIIW